MNEMNKAKSRRLKAAGVEQVESHNERWVDRARRTAIGLCKKNGSVTCDDLRREMGNDKPAHPNAYGAVFRRPFVWTGAVEHSECVSRHSGLQRIWKIA